MMSKWFSSTGVRRRLVRGYEQRLDVSEAMIFIAVGSSLLYRMRFR